MTPPFYNSKVALVKKVQGGGGLKEIEYYNHIDKT